MPRWPTLVTLMAVVACPAAAQTVLRPGQTVQGELTASDPTLPDGSHYDCFTVQTRRGQTLQIDQTSDAFDSYLQAGMGTCAGNLSNLASDDDSGGGLNARLQTQGDGGVLTLRANSLSAGSTGRYTLTVSESGQPSTEPQSAEAATAPQPSNISSSDPQEYPGPAPWVQPVSFLTNSGETRIFAGRPQQAQPNNPTIWMWIYLRQPRGVGTQGPDGGDGKHNIIAQSFRINCRSRTSQSLHVQAFWWEFGDDMPRSILSATQNGPAQPTTPGTSADLLVTSACAPESTPQSGTDFFPSAWIAMMETHIMGS